MKAIFESIAAPSDTSFAYRLFRLQSFPFRWHFHPEYELTLIVAGQGRRFVGDHIEDFTAGDLVLLGKNLPHTWHSEQTSPAKAGQAQAIVIQFPEDFLGTDFFSRPEMARTRRLLNRSSRGVAFGRRAHRAVASRIHKMRDLNPFASMLELLSILDILARTSDATELASAGYIPTLKSEDQRRIERVYRFISENFTRDLRLADAAALAHLSPPAFSRFFHKVSGRPFNAYVNELRIGSACRLLIETDWSINQIALGVGFNNLSNFNRRFLAIKGLQPLKYREQFCSRDKP